jgi:Adenylate and Guanylate cyclase catalytic domain
VPTYTPDPGVLRMTSPLTCMSCGTELRSSAKFCDVCGSPIASAGIPAEYKQVTVLFADVVRSMDVAAAVGAERLREIMIELINRSAAVVRRYGGTLDKFTGDGVMAVFGAPVALEDHALRACLAALGIQDEAKRLAAEVGQLPTTENLPPLMSAASAKESRRSTVRMLALRMARSSVDVIPDSIRMYGRSWIWRTTNLPAAKGSYDPQHSLPRFDSLIHKAERIMNRSRVMVVVTVSTRIMHCQSIFRRSR